jgi:hypothetical protein
MRERDALVTRGAGGVRRISADEVCGLLGPAEAQYAPQELELTIVGATGTLGCDVEIVDQSADDMNPEPRLVAFAISWNDLAGETGYRAQLDVGSPTFVNEDEGDEVAANTTSVPIGDIQLDPGDSGVGTFRVFGHVGHAPNHGATPIAGDVVSNECAVTVSRPAEP